MIDSPALIWCPSGKMMLLVWLLPNGIVSVAPAVATDGSARRRASTSSAKRRAADSSWYRDGGERERDGGGIELNVRAARQILKIERAERAQPDSSDDEAGCRRSAGEDKAFGDELPCNSRPSCAERQSRRQFLAARP